MGARGGTRAVCHSVPKRAKALGYGDYDVSYLLYQSVLSGARLPSCSPGNLRPGGSEAVVGEGLLRPAVALGDEVEAVGEVAGRLAEGAHLLEEGAGLPLAGLIEGADHRLHD